MSLEFPSICSAPHLTSSHDEVKKEEPVDPKKSVDLVKVAGFIKAIGFYDIVDPQELICSISKEIMISPVMLKECGHIFNEQSIKDWYATKKEEEKFCPICSVLAKEYVPARLLKNIIDKLMKHPLWNEEAFYNSIANPPTEAEPEYKANIASIVSDWRKGDHTSEYAIGKLYDLATEVPESEEACEEAVGKLLKKVQSKAATNTDSQTSSSCLSCKPLCNPSCTPVAPFKIFPSLSGLPLGLPIGLKGNLLPGTIRKPRETIHVYSSGEELSVD